MPLIWSAVTRGPTVLAECGEDNRAGEVLRLAQKILRKKATPGWESERVGSLRALKFHVYSTGHAALPSTGTGSSSGGSGPVMWSICCVYDSEFPELQVRSALRGTPGRGCRRQTPLPLHPTSTTGAGFLGEVGAHVGAAPQHARLAARWHARRAGHLCGDAVATDGAGELRWAAGHGELQSGGGAEHHGGQHRAAAAQGRPARRSGRQGHQHEPNGTSLPPARPRRKAIPAVAAGQVWSGSRHSRHRRRRDCSGAARPRHRLVIVRTDAGCA
eukprot:scaffold8247_cov116-Isochrysis_galbana.AAC.7